MAQHALRSAAMNISCAPIGSRETDLSSQVVAILKVRPSYLFLPKHALAPSRSSSHTILPEYHKTHIARKLDTRRACSWENILEIWLCALIAASDGGERQALFGTKLRGWRILCPHTASYQYQNVVIHNPKAGDGAAAIRPNHTFSYMHIEICMFRPRYLRGCDQPRQPHCAHACTIESAMRVTMGENALKVLSNALVY